MLEFGSRLLICTTIFLGHLCQNILAAYVDTIPTSFQPMQLSFLDMHARCEGVCFYFTDAGWDQNGDCTGNAAAGFAVNCSMIFSIVKFTPQCAPGTAIVPFLETVFCNETQIKKHEIYKVSLARRVDEKDCDNDGKSTFCLSRAFVAVAFSTNPTNLQLEDNPFYTCVGDEEHVQSWVLPTTVVNSPRGNVALMVSNQTEPFIDYAVGSLWSVIKEPKLEHSLVCTFYISDGSYKYWTADGVEKSFHFGQFGGGGGWNIKMARGLGNRALSTFFIDELYFNTVDFCRDADVRPDEETAEQVCDGAQTVVAPRPTLTAATIAAKSPPTRPVTQSDPDLNFNNLQAMTDIYRDCMEMKRFCYTFTNERGCLHEEMCHLLVAIQSIGTQFDRLHFDILSHSRDLPGVVKFVRPSGWASVGFSVDQNMGDDFVLTCGYYGARVQAYVTLNLEGVNLYYQDAAYQNLITNKMYRVGKKESELEHRVMCSFDLQQTVGISINKRPFERRELDFNLKDREYFVLLAHGTTVSKRFNTSYHTSKEVIRRKFSKMNYDAEISAGPSGRSISKSTIITVLLLFVSSLLM